MTYIFGNHVMKIYTNEALQENHGSVTFKHLRQPVQSASFLQSLSTFEHILKNQTRRLKLFGKSINKTRL